LRDTAVYYVSRKTLWARALSTGKLLWSQPLRGPAGPWCVAGRRGALLAYPVHVPTLPRWYWVALGGALLPLPAGGRPGREFAIHCCDPKDGRLVQRLNFPGPALHSAVQVLPRGLVVEVGCKAWGVAGAE
jgi:hypothetical protein